MIIAKIDIIPSSRLVAGEIYCKKVFPAWKMLELKHPGTVRTNRTEWRFQVFPE